MHWENMVLILEENTKSTEMWRYIGNWCEETVYSLMRKLGKRKMWHRDIRPDIENMIVKHKFVNGLYKASVL